MNVFFLQSFNVIILSSEICFSLYLLQFFHYDKFFSNNSSRFMKCVLTCSLKFKMSYLKLRFVSNGTCTWCHFHAFCARLFFFRFYLINAEVFGKAWKYFRAKFMRKNIKRFWAVEKNGVTSREKKSQHENILKCMLNNKWINWILSKYFCIRKQINRTHESNVWWVDAYRKFI